MDCGHGRRDCYYGSDEVSDARKFPSHILFLVSTLQSRPQRDMQIYLTNRLKPTMMKIFEHVIGSESKHAMYLPFTGVCCDSRYLRDVFEAAR